MAQILDPKPTVKKTDDFFYHLSLFNWFLGILLIFSGLAFFIFPNLTPNQQLINYLGYLRLIKIFLIVSGGALIVLGSDRLHNTTSEKVFYSFICFLNIFLVLIFFKTGDYLAVATNGILTIALLIFLIYKFTDLTKIIFLIDGWMIASGIIFYLWPDFLEFGPLAYWIKNNLYLFATIWILAIFILLILSRLSLKGNKKALLIFSLAVAIPSLIISVITLVVGINDIVLYSAVLSIFSFGLPIWLYVEPLGSLSRTKLLNAFSWWLIIIIIGTLLSFYTQNLFKVFLTSDLTDRAKNTASSIQSYLDDRQLIVQGFQSSDELVKLMSSQKKDPVALEKKLKELYLASRKFLRIIAVDETGKIIAAYPNDLSLIGQEIGSQNYFQNARNSSQVAISDFIQTQIAFPVIYVSSRLNASDGKFLGVVSGIIDTADINDLLQNFKYDELTNFLMVDSKNNILIGNKTIQEQGGAMEAFASVKNYNWKITVEQPFKNSAGGDRTVASVVFLASIISAISSLFIMLYVRRRTVAE